jgi:hypothetical protein
VSQFVVQLTRRDTAGALGESRWYIQSNSGMDATAVVSGYHLLLEMEGARSIV